MAKNGLPRLFQDLQDFQDLHKNSSTALRHGPKTEKCSPTLDCFIPKRFDWLASGKSHPLHPNCYRSLKGLMHDAVKRVSSAEMKSSWYVYSMHAASATASSIQAMSHDCPLSRAWLLTEWSSLGSPLVQISLERCWEHRITRQSIPQTRNMAPPELTHGYAVISSAPNGSDMVRKRRSEFSNGASWSLSGSLKNLVASPLVGDLDAAFGSGFLGPFVCKSRWITEKKVQLRIKRPTVADKASGRFRVDRHGST